MHFALIAVLLSAGPGASFGGARPLAPGSMQGVFTATTGAHVTASTYKAARSGTLESIHGSVTAAGTGGGATFTLAVTADAVVICSGEVSCTVAGEFDIACTGTFESGQDLHLEIDASSCGANPAFIARAAWLW